MNNILQTINDTTYVNDSVATFHINWWMIVAIIEFISLICLVLHKKYIPTEQEKLKQKILKEGKDIDFGNTIQSAFNAKELYDKLRVKCHPDRFVGDNEKVAIAEELSLLTGKNKHNINVLMTIKNRAEKELGVHF